MTTGGTFGGGRCAVCGAFTKNRTCKPCYLAASAPSTPIRDYTRRTGVSIAKLARECDVPLRSMREYASGHGVGGSLGRRAILLAQRTGLSLEVILLGTIDDPPQEESDD